MLNSPLLKGVLERSGVPLRVPLQYLLEELMRWYSSSLQWPVEHKKDPKTIMAQKLNDVAKEMKARQAERQRKKDEAQEQLRNGRKRFHDMSATEILSAEYEKLECGRSKRSHDEV